MLKDDAPPSLVLESGYKPSENWALYGDVWAQPTVGRYGADATARYKGSVDFYAGGLVDTKQDDWEVNAGVRYSW